MRYRDVMQRDYSRCDYGDCQAAAVSLVGYTREWRPMCAKHAARVMGWDARLRLRIIEVQVKASHES